MSVTTYPFKHVVLHMRRKTAAFAAALILGACFTPTGSVDSSPTAATTEGPLTTGTSPGTTGTTTEVAPTTGVSPTSPTTGDPVTGTSTGPCVTAGCDCEDDSGCDDGLHCLASECVECFDDAHCDGQTCDLEAHVCRSCEEHSDCPGTACELDDGRCFPMGETVHAYVNPGACAGLECTSDLPCCTVDEAFARYLDSTDYLVVHLASNQQYSPFALTEDGKRVAVLGGDNARIAGAIGGEAGLILLGGDSFILHSELYVARLTIQDSSGTGVSCASADLLWLDDVDIVNQGGRPLSAADCSLVARRSELRFNSRGLSVDGGGAIELVNTAVAHNGQGPALELHADGRFALLYTTVADASGQLPSLIGCVDPTATFSARNSVLVSDSSSDVTDCIPSALDIRDAAVSALDLVNSDNNISLVMWDDVPMQFLDWIGGDLHVAPDNKFKDHAVWRTGDPATDLDGDARPHVDGAVDVAGADIPAAGKP